MAIAFSVLLLVPVGFQNAAAVSFDSNQIGPNEWTYDLTFDPLDNYSIFQQFTTIKLTGLCGVTDAMGPIDNDFPIGNFLNNLDWTAEVLNGGTTVVWTHDGPGTGNFSDERHTFGFKINSNSPNGQVDLMTDGFSRDDTDPLPDGTFDLDITGLVQGPTGCVIGGEMISLDTSMILLAGTQTIAAWMIPVLVSGIGIAIVIARKI